MQKAQKETQKGKSIKIGSEIEAGSELEEISDVTMMVCKYFAALGARKEIDKAIAVLEERRREIQLYIDEFFQTQEEKS